jgi:hypothetical protein
VLRRTVQPMVSTAAPHARAGLGGSRCSAASRSPSTRWHTPCLAVAADPAFSTVLMATLAESARQDLVGYAEDIDCFRSDWTPALRRVQQRVHLLHGREEFLVRSATVASSPQRPPTPSSPRSRAATSRSSPISRSSLSPCSPAETRGRHRLGGKPGPAPHSAGSSRNGEAAKPPRHPQCRIRFGTSGIIGRGRLGTAESDRKSFGLRDDLGPRWVGWSEDHGPYRVVVAMLAVQPSVDERSLR